MPRRQKPTASPARAEKTPPPQPVKLPAVPALPNPTLLPRQLDRDWRPAFLAALAEHGVITTAAQQAGIHRGTVYDERERNPEFARLWDEAVQMSTDSLVREAIRRAREGTLKPDYYRGQVVGATREYSDRLMEVTLKARLPDEYGDRVVIRLSKADKELLERYGFQSVGEALETYLRKLAEADHQKTNQDSTMITAQFIKDDSNNGKPG